MHRDYVWLSLVRSDNHRQCEAVSDSEKQRISKAPTSSAAAAAATTTTTTSTSTSTTTTTTTTGATTSTATVQRIDFAANPYSLLHATMHLGIYL